MATIRVYRAELATAAARIRVYRAEATVVANEAGSGRIRVFRAELTTLGPASLGNDLKGIEPWATVTLTATATGSPVSWEFRQVSGPAVTLVPAGNKVSFTAPATLQTRSVSIGATAVYSGGAKGGEAAVNIEVLHATEYINSPTGFVPVELQTFAPTA